MDNTIKRIANTIIANLDNSQEIGLFNGKMGISIFLYKYAAYSGEKVYSDIADDLIDEISSKITSDFSPSAMDGIASIGYGFSLLLKEHLLEGDLDDVLFDIDKRLLQNAKSALLKEMSFPIPVYSSGIYLLSRISFDGSERENKWIAGTIEMAIYFITTCVIEKKYNPKLSLLNSMLFVFSRLYEKNEYSRINSYQLLDDILTLALNTIKSKQQTNPDLMLFRQMISILPERLILKYKAEMEQLNLAKVSIDDIESWNNNLWWSFLYNVISKERFSKNEIKQYVDKKLLESSFELMTINNQLAILGLWLMQIEKNEKRFNKI